MGGDESWGAMIYDHGLVGCWRDRVTKEEEAARDNLRQFIGQRKGKIRPKTASNDLKYNSRNGPWANGGNFGVARFDQPYSDMQERRLNENIDVWEKGYKPQPFKAIAPGKQTQMLKEKKEMEDALRKAKEGEPDSARLSTARTRLTTPDTALIRMSPLTDLIPEPHEKGLKKSWLLMESDPVKIQLRQEDLVHTKGTLENNTMTKLCPLMKSRPKTAKSRPGSAMSFTDIERGFRTGWKDGAPAPVQGPGLLGEDGSRGGLTL